MAARRARVAVSDEERAELTREGATMILYVAVVEIAELAALPERHLPGGVVTGPVGSQLLAILWGTALGLALAHWFAFGIVTPALHGRSRPTRRDGRIAAAQLGGAAIVAALSSVPVLFLSDVHAQETVGAVPALIVALVGYLVARAGGCSRPRAAGYGAIAVAVGIGVALAKSALAAH